MDEELGLMEKNYFEFHGIDHRDKLPSLCPAAARVCEVGVLSGVHLANLATGAGVCFGVDMWRDDGSPGVNDAHRDLDVCYLQAREVQERRGNVVLLRMSSQEAVECFPDYFFDLVYIDANHVYEHARADVEAWWHKVRRGGVLSGHDYLEYDINGVRFGTKRAVDEFAESRSLSVHSTSEEFPSWMVRRPICSSR